LPAGTFVKWKAPFSSVLVDAGAVGTVETSLPLQSRLSGATEPSLQY